LIADMAVVPVMDPAVEVAQQQILALSIASEDLEWTALQWLEFTWLCVLICWVGAQAWWMIAATGGWSLSSPPSRWCGSPYLLQRCCSAERRRWR
jgi:hypothetical protein